MPRAKALIKALRSEDFDVWQTAQADLLKLMLAEKSKAESWDKWIGGEKVRPENKDVQRLFPENIAFRSKLTGLFQMRVSKGEVNWRLKLAYDGTVELWTGDSKGTKYRQIGNGKYVVKWDKSIVIRCAVDAVQADEWQAAGTLVENTLKLKTRSAEMSDEEEGNASEWKRVEK